MIRHSSTVELPNPTPVLFLIAACLAWSFSADDPGVLGPALAILLATILLAAVVAAVSRRPVIAVVALIASGAMARLYVEVFQLKLRPEHMAVIVACMAVPFWRSLPRPRWSVIDLLLALYAAANLLSSLFMSIAPKKTLVWAAQQVLVILPYFLLRFLCSDWQRFRRAFNILLAVGTAQAAIGIFCFLSNLLFGTQFGMEIGQYGEIPGTFGVAYEANILAAISACTFIMAMWMYLSERRRIQLWAMLVAYAGMLIALSRAAVGAALVATLLLVIFSFWTGQLQWKPFKGMASALVVCTLLLLPLVAPLYAERFSSVDVSDVSADPDTLGRVIVLVSAVDGIIAHPLLGNGTSSFQLLSSSQDLGFGDDDRASWIGNTEMRVLHDTGIIGFGLFVSVVVALAWRAAQMLRRQRSPELIALLLGCVVYGVTFQATEGTLMEFFWVQLGLLACAACLLESSPLTGLNALANFEPRAGGPVA